MKVTVVGKELIAGVSKKTGNDYAFIKVYYTADREGVKGQITGDLTLEPEKHPLDSIDLDGLYDVDFDQRGRLCGFSPLF